MIAVALSDYWPFNRRSFATKGTNPPFSKDDPRSFGAGVIKRIQLQNRPNLFGQAGGNFKEPQIGDNKNGCHSMYTTNKRGLVKIGVS